MPANRKVIWSEGILLGQQHFQQWDKYLHHQQRLSHQMIGAYAWGIAKFEYDESYLPQGIFQLNRCVALFQDGRWVDFDQIFDGALTITLPNEAVTRLGVCLVLPLSESVSGITGYPETTLAAWEGSYINVGDQYDPEREREVLLGQQNLKLMFEGDIPQGVAFIKIAELEYDPSQQVFKMNPQYYPPALKIGASHHFVAWVNALTGKLKRYIERLSDQKIKHQHISNQFGYGDFIYFNLTKTLATHWAAFSSLQSTSECHPYFVYDTAIRLLGELSGYQDTPMQASELPTYRHNQLSEVFETISRRIEELIEQAVPANSMDVSLYKISETQFQSTPLKLDDLNNKQYCLALYHENLTDELIEKIQAQVKIAAPSRITSIVQSFTQGIELNYLASPGKNLIPKRSYHYFLMNKQSPEWQGLIEEKMIAIFISQDLVFLPFEIVAYS